MTGEARRMIDHERTKFRRHHRHTTSGHGFVAGGTRASLFTRVQHVTHIQCHVVTSTHKCIVANLTNEDNKEVNNIEDDNKDVPDEPDLNDCSIYLTDLVWVTVTEAVSPDSSRQSWEPCLGAVASCTPPRGRGAGRGHPAVPLAHPRQSLHLLPLTTMLFVTFALGSE